MAWRALQTDDRPATRRCRVIAVAFRLLVVGRLEHVANARERLADPGLPGLTFELLTEAAHPEAEVLQVVAILRPPDLTDQLSAQVTLSAFAARCWRSCHSVTIVRLAEPRPPSRRFGTAACCEVPQPEAP